jgi:hypothetical protein
MERRILLRFNTFTILCASFSRERPWLVLGRGHCSCRTSTSVETPQLESKYRTGDFPLKSRRCPQVTRNCGFRSETPIVWMRENGKPAPESAVADAGITNDQINWLYAKAQSKRRDGFNPDSTHQASQYRGSALESIKNRNGSLCTGKTFKSIGISLPHHAALLLRSNFSTTLWSFLTRR